MHIAIVGNIGAGKTTLTKLLADHFKYEPQFEAVDNNPYLEDFYADMKRWSFNLQIFFLNSRFRQIVELQKTNIDMIQDRTIYEDAYIFAENLYDMGLMSARDFENYSNIFQSIIHYIKPPDLLIYLKASVPTLVNNIQVRGRDYESGIRLDYLSKLNEKYDKWIDNYKDGKLMVLDKDNLDFTKNPEDLGTIVEKIESQLFGLF
ncbi:MULTISPECIES: deoxynucleoside kinase [Sphingobacterium]|jgi:deoxyadenosine/deoxycytidine kinase|uniref:Deoxynucleoside kinase n=2 Tax=Sphingobacterium TaxID=28453 RepID=A0ABW5YPQ8_9SPHI|nr:MULTISPECIES: deoxynucleoside kinase [Sphingobacterium]KKX49969.1 deoxynucleoside kinase [Sphingobacterium sp. IITKGP-BTPF85]MBB2951420.1 deoxyadenosine/deoxycytidine kinase [Sphingobacterium sp. JUb56]MCS3556339.1 deoxyadenosine/deoxycytidine kinase [Sphingobacterium sp. JUb21]MCW2259933.1 deoxyadenosine/deoxycytidine kinase [Sphingobacterium kitahiroshimense]NJI72118.1 deoxynucleoside kinase [Sphingobacterium sp. B16(2022)]